MENFGQSWKMLYLTLKLRGGRSFSWVDIIQSIENDQLSLALHRTTRPNLYFPCENIHKSLNVLLNKDNHISVQIFLLYPLFWKRGLLIQIVITLLFLLLLSTWIQVFCFSCFRIFFAKVLKKPVSVSMA